MNDDAPQMSIGQCATLACLLEATAPKVGNVHRGADFEGLCFTDFVVSAAQIGPPMELARRDGVGQTVLRAVEATAAAVGSNTNLGIALLLAPLAAVPEMPIAALIGPTLERMDENDAARVYEAIRLASPGGLGESEKWDVQRQETPPSLLDAMQLASERDLVARQYCEGFSAVLETARHIESELLRGVSIEKAILLAQLQRLAADRDTLIERKGGADLAGQASLRAGAVLQAREHGPDAFEHAIGDFDFWLRSDGNRRNPGATADLIAAALFVLLREQRMPQPIPTVGHLARRRRAEEGRLEQGEQKTSSLGETDD